MLQRTGLRAPCHRCIWFGACYCYCYSVSAISSNMARRQRAWADAFSGAFSPACYIRWLMTTVRMSVSLSAQKNIEPSSIANLHIPCACCVWIQIHCFCPRTACSDRLRLTQEGCRSPASPWLVQTIPQSLPSLQSLAHSTLEPMGLGIVPPSHFFWPFWFT